MSRMIKNILIICFLFAFSAYNAEAYVFTKDLRLGDTHPDVLELQKSLNQSHETKVAEVGPGSPGQETMYFGPATQSALMRYQRIYLDLSTGFFGPITRASISKIPSNSPVAVVNTNQNVYSTNSQASGVLAFETIFPREKNIISRIKITESSPEKAGVDSVITIKGEGFEKSNDIYSVIGVIKNVPAKDGVIEIKVSDFPEIKRIKDKARELKNLPVNIRIGNKNGLSTNFAYFIINP